jgi:hypothetical protein
MSITILVRRKHMGDENWKDAQAKRHVNVSKKKASETSLFW